MGLICRAASEFKRVLTADTQTHRHLRERLTIVFVASLAVDAVCSVIAYFVERHAAGTDIHSYGTAAFWTTAQMLTISSQMADPVTTGGRILDVFMEIYGMTAVTTLAGSFGAFFLHRSRERSQAAVQVSSSGS